MKAGYYLSFTEVKFMNRTEKYANVYARDVRVSNDLRQ